MQRLKLLGLCLVAVFALGAITSTAAFATEEGIHVLTKAKVESENFKLSGTSVKTTKLQILKLALEVICSETTTEANQEGKALLGTFHLHFKKCTTNGGGTCTGLGDEAGLILALGTFHLVQDKLLSEGTLGAGILLLLETLHFTCEVAGLKKLILVKGEVLCLISPLTLATKVKVKCEKGAEVGDPGEIVYWKDTAPHEKVTMSTSALLASEGEGEFLMAAEEGEGEATANEELEIMD